MLPPRDSALWRRCYREPNMHKLQSTKMCAVQKVEFKQNLLALSSVSFNFTFGEMLNCVDAETLPSAVLRKNSPALCFRVAPGKVERKHVSNLKFFFFSMSLVSGAASPVLVDCIGAPAIFQYIFQSFCALTASSEIYFTLQLSPKSCGNECFGRCRNNSCPIRRTNLWHLNVIEFFMELGGRLLDLFFWFRWKTSLIFCWIESFLKCLLRL